MLDFALHLKVSLVEKILSYCEYVLKPNFDSLPSKPYRKILSCCKYIYIYICLILCCI